MNRFVVAGIIAVFAVGCAAQEGDEGESVGKAGQAETTGAAFYADGVLYRTVGTPTDFSGTNAPESSFETIWAFRGAQRYNVAAAAPGEAGFKGGRWRVHGLSIANYAAALAKYDANGSGDFDSDEEVNAALAGGDFVDIGVLKTFECPVIPLSQSGR